jgi:hypothetical protein
LRNNGIELNAIVDRDRGKTEISSTNIKELEETNLENILLEPNTLYESLISIKGDYDVINKGIDRPEEVKNLIHNIISRECIIEHEIKLELDSHLDFSLGFGASEEIDKEKLLGRFDDHVSSKRDHIESEFEDIKEDVETKSENGDISEFDGDRILGEIAGEFQVGKEELRNITAEKMHEKGTHPDYLNDIVEGIIEDVNPE